MTPSQTNTRPKTWTIGLAFAAIYLIWGSTYLAALIGLESIPPFLLASLRFLVAGGLLYGWCQLNGERISRATLPRNAFSGTMMLAGGTGSVIWAEQYLPSGLAAIIVTTLPLWFIILDRPQWGTYRANKGRLLGLALGFGGILLLFGEDPAVFVPNNKAGMYWISIGVIMMGTVCWAIGSLYARYRPAPGSMMLNVSVQLLAAGLFCGLLSAVIGEWNGFDMDQVTTRAWLALAYMTLLGSLVAYMSYLWLLQVRPSTVVGTYAYVNPVVAVLLGWSLAHESVSVRQVVALAVILVGVLLVNRTSAAATKN